MASIKDQIRKKGQSDNKASPQDANTNAGEAKKNNGSWLPSFFGSKKNSNDEAHTPDLNDDDEVVDFNLASQNETNIAHIKTISNIENEPNFIQQSSDIDYTNENQEKKSSHPVQKIIEERIENRQPQKLRQPIQPLNNGIDMGMNQVPAQKPKQPSQPIANNQLDLSNLDIQDLGKALLSQSDFLLKLGNVIKQDISGIVLKYILERFHFVENQAYTKTLQLHNELLESLKNVNIDLHNKEKYKEQLIQEITNNNQEIVDQNNTITEKTEYITGLSNQVERLNNEVSTLGNQKLTISNDIDRLNEDVIQAQGELDKVKSDVELVANELGQKIVDVASKSQQDLIKRQQEEYLEISKNFSNVIAMIQLGDFANLPKDYQDVITKYNSIKHLIPDLENTNQ